MKCASKLPSLAGTYHSGKDIHFAIDNRGNVRTYAPNVNLSRHMAGRPVGFLEVQLGSEYLEYRASYVDGRRSDWLAVRDKALQWLGDRVRETRYGAGK
jgi:hypothetical protein